jgi:hypothetical protein
MGKRQPMSVREWIIRDNLTLNVIMLFCDPPVAGDGVSVRR